MRQIEPSGGEVKTDVERAEEVYRRVRDVFLAGTKPVATSYIKTNMSGQVCACAVGALAMSFGAGRNDVYGYRSGVGVRDTAAKIGGISPLEALNLEGGFMDCVLGETGSPFFEVGARLRKEFLEE